MPRTDIFTLAAMCLEYLNSQGYEVVDRVINRDLLLDIEAMEGRAPVTPLLSPVENDFRSGNSFWLLLKFNKEIVGTLGARYDFDQQQSVGEHLADLHNRHFGKQSSSTVFSNLPERAKSYRGGFVYMGDVFFSKSHRGDVAKTQCFCQLAFAMAFSRWWGGAAHVIALHRHADVLVGKAEQYGFTTDKFAVAQNWIYPPQGRGSMEHLSVLSLEDFLRGVRLFSENPALLLDPPVRPRSRPDSTALSKSSR